MIETSLNSECFTLRATGQLTLRESGTVKDFLAQALERYREIEVDLSAVEVIDLPCLQLLYCAKQLARESVRRPQFRVILPEGLMRGLAHGEP
ncbi:MAG: hypothetical protein BWY87_00960 [Deltaproteobacteria bacterium ADurb.Bin510]|nr:MAG: hypothetical protein BWY87_00960 [Deltaproteobacteria bacterium ADurb.Bin510]